MKLFFLKLKKKNNKLIVSEFLSLGKTSLREENVHVLSVAELEEVLLYKQMLN